MIVCTYLLRVVTICEPACGHGPNLWLLAGGVPGCPAPAAWWHSVARVFG